MDMTILNKNVSNAAAIEQIVNGVIALAIEQGITPETHVDVDQPLTLGSIEVSGIHMETRPEVDPAARFDSEPPKPE